MHRSSSESSVDSATGAQRVSLPGEIGRLLFVLTCLMACFAAGVVAYLREGISSDVYSVNMMI